MTSPAQPGFGVDEPASVRPSVPRTGIEPWRIAVSAVIVAVVVAAVWLWGRPHQDPPRALVAVTAEAWLAGQVPGAFEAVAVPEELSGQFADPESIAGSLVAFDVPAGTFVTSALLGPPGAASGTHTVMRFSADTSAWPDPGPGAGSRAVVAGVLGGCAIGVTTLAGGSEDGIVVRVDAAGAARYALAAELDGLVVWPAPPDGWPECRSAATGTANTPRIGSDASTGIGNEMPPGLGDGQPPSMPFSEPAGG
ncbi:hypothetical protein [Candidatus Poriferisodalis sp.]|uniref:hypothetical protein n=1 Tax=Candidatus Poriferisodalis sp. TaxID=3101277 RepID=UPI003B0143B6